MPKPSAEAPAGTRPEAELLLCCARTCMDSKSTKQIRALLLLSLYLMKLVVDAVTTGLTVPDKVAAFGRVGLLIGLTGIVTLVGALV